MSGMLFMEKAPVLPVRAATSRSHAAPGPLRTLAALVYLAQPSTRGVSGHAVICRRSSLPDHGRWSPAHHLFLAPARMLQGARIRPTGLRTLHSGACIVASIHTHDWQKAS
jgi:hypothetical protein